MAMITSSGYYQRRKQSNRPPFSPNLSTRVHSDAHSRNPGSIYDMLQCCYVPPSATYSRKPTAEHHRTLHSRGAKTRHYFPVGHRGRRERERDTIRAGTLESLHPRAVQRNGTTRRLLGTERQQSTADNSLCLCLCVFCCVYGWDLPRSDLRPLVYVVTHISSSYTAPFPRND